MAAPSEKLAQSLEVLMKLQKSGSSAAIRARDLSRTHKERLLKNGFLQEVIKGWYIPSRPEEAKGDSTSWYTSFWQFCVAYLNDRFSKEWCLSPEQSIFIHAGNWTVPTQLLIRSPKASNNITNLPYNTSIFDHKSQLPDVNEVVEKDGVRILSLTSSLIKCSESLFKSHPIDTRTALSLVSHSSDLLQPLLDGNHTIISGRLAGAYRNISNNRIADDIIKTMESAGHKVREYDPFDNTLDTNLSISERSPYVQRIRLMWQQMRETVLEYFPAAPGIPEDIRTYMKQVEDIYTTDAYHSLSIEGYRVSIELIERVRSGNWDPEKNSQDLEHRNAMAARGYWQAFQAVIKSINKVLEKHNPGTVVDEDHSSWYLELFGPSVTAGLLKPSDLSGYRSDPVYIRQSMHAPMNRDAVRDCMPVLFELLAEESEPAVRAVLGHFIFVYIHPYMDGNGRMGRFLLNVMLASGGYPWTVVPVESRDDYMAALERASVNQDISTFAQFLSNLVTNRVD